MNQNIPAAASVSNPDLTTDSHASLMAVSPLDGRYANRLRQLQPLMSEFGLIKHRVLVEIRWLLTLSRLPALQEVRMVTDEEVHFLESIIDRFDAQEAMKVKNIEATTNHDVKAVEYYIKERLSQTDLRDIMEFVHFAATSEDINNLSYALMLKQAREDLVLPEMHKILDELLQLSQQTAELPLLSRTHGQPASPTTMGKEVANVMYRLKRQILQLQSCDILGKFNGAVGNYNAHYAAYPEIKWYEISEQFVKALGLSWQPYSTQIEPHDFIAEYLDCINRFNTILIDLSRDMWTYISRDYFSQKLKEGEVGSSTMPHKVNPIDFENAEGNLGIAIAVNKHLGGKLPISRQQRDLTDSTVLRSLGVGIGHSLIAYQSLLKGLSKLQINQTVIEREINEAWVVLAEAIQTVMRRYDIEKPYEKLKALTRGKTIDQSTVRDFIQQLEIDTQAKQQLLELTPQTYLGNAVSQTRTIALAMQVLEQGL